MSILAQTQPRNEGAFGSSRHDGILLSRDRKEWELRNQFISDWWMLIRSICLLCWKLMRSQIPGVYIDPFTRLCHTRLFCEYQPCCLPLGIPVWQEGPRSACWLPETRRHCRHTGQVPHRLQQHWDHPNKEVTPVTEPLLAGQGHTCEETISTSLLSPKYKLWHDWTAPSTPTNIPAALSEVAGSGPCPQQAAG